VDVIYSEGDFRVGVLYGAIASVVLLLSTSTTLHAQTLKEALAQTYNSNPAIAAARSELKATAESLPQARAAFMPDLTFTAYEGFTKTRTETTVTGSSASNKVNETNHDRQIELEATLNVFEGGSGVAGINAAEAQIAAGVASLADTEQGTMISAIEAYGNVVLYAATVQAYVQMRDELLKLKEQTDYQYKSQSVTITDVSQVNAYVAEVEGALYDYVGELNAAKKGFESVIGTSPGTLEKWPELPPLPQTLAETIKIAAAMNPEVIEAEFTLKYGEFMVDYEKGDLLPSLDFSNTVEREWDQERFTSGSDYTEHDMTATWSYGMTLTVPLYSGGATYSEVREAKQTVAQYRGELQDTRNSSVYTAASNWETMVAGKKQVDAYQKQADYTVKAIDGLKRQYSNGTGTMSDVLTAQENLATAYADLYAAQYSTFVAKAEVLEAIGQLTPQILGLDVEVYDSQAYIERMRNTFLGFSLD
jgi:outer membrane protein